MSTAYWPGELLQTLSISSNQLSINPGNTVTLPAGGAVSIYSTASISSLTVSTINGVPPENLDVADWSLFPCVNSTLNMAGNALTNASLLSTTLLRSGDIINDNTVYTAVVLANGVTATNLTAYSTITGNQGNFSTINASTINTNVLNATSTIHAISTISSTTLEVQEIVNLSSINGQSLSTLAGAADWSLYPAASTIQVAGNNVTGISTLQMNGVFQNAGSTVSSATTIYNGNAGEDFAYFQQISQSPGGLSSINALTTGGVNNGADWRYIYGNSTIGAIFMRDGDGGIGMVDKGMNLYLFANNTFTNSNISTLSLYTSSINGAEFTTGGGGGVIVSTITTSLISTVGASIQQGLMSSIVFNPQINPQFNIDLGLGSGLTALGTGLFAVAVGVPTLAGTLTYGLVKGLASVFEPKPNVTNVSITNDQFEVFNYASQLQVSTLGHYVSTVYQFVSTIPSTIVINNSTINSTIAFCDVPYFVSTISQSSTPTCIRAIADPTQTVSTPWNYSQSLPEWSWVEIPATGGGGGNVSTLSLSTLQLSPSTILKGDLPQTFQVLSQSNTYNQVAALTYTCSDAPGSANNGSYAVNVSNDPMYINSNFSSFTFALQNSNVNFNQVNFPVKDGNQSTITNLFINNAAEPSLTYAVYPPGFPSTTTGYVNFKSSLNGGYGGVQLMSQFASNSRLDVGQFVYATNLVVGDNDGYPLTVTVPGIEGYPLLAMSTIGPGIAGSEVIGLTSSGTGQLTINAPTTAQSTTQRMMVLDSQTSTVTVLNTLSTNNINVGNINGSAYPPAFPTSISVNSITASNSAVLSNAQITNLVLESGNMALGQNFISTTGAGIFLESFSNLASPSGIYTVMNNLDATPSLRNKAAIYMCGNTSSIGINDIADGYTFDVTGNARIKEGLLVNRLTVISTISTVKVQALANEFVSLGAVSRKYDAYGIGNTLADGVQPVTFGGFGTFDTSFGGGLGQTEIAMPYPISSILAANGMYIAFQDSSPGLTHPIWLYSTVNNGSGLISSVQFGGGQNTDATFNIIGYV